MAAVAEQVYERMREVGIPVEGIKEFYRRQQTSCFGINFGNGSELTVFCDQKKGIKTYDLVSTEPDRTYEERLLEILEKIF